MQFIWKAIRKYVVYQKHEHSDDTNFREHFGRISFFFFLQNKIGPFLKKVFVSMTTYAIMSSNPVPSEVYSIQHYVIKFVSDLRQVGGFIRILRFPSPIKLTTT
jgi:hypothetical protein